MIIVESIVGNKNTDIELEKQYEELAKENASEIITLTRFESQRSRMRKVSDKGTDVAINLPAGNNIKNGDVLVLNKDKVIVAEIEPEKVILLSIKEDNLSIPNLIEISIRIGHTIGNLHRPLRIEKSKIYFPIQSDTEIETFRKLFESIIDHIQLSPTMIVFEPTTGTDVHEH